MPYIGTSPSNGVRQTYDYTATAGQTSFSGSDNNSQTLTYTDSAYIDVYQNGILLVPSDYTATTGTTVVLDTGATVSDTLQIVVYDVFSVADTVSASDGGSFGGNVGVGGTLSVTGNVISPITLAGTTPTATFFYFFFFLLSVFPYTAMHQVADHLHKLIIFQLCIQHFICVFTPDDTSCVFVFLHLVIQTLNQCHYGQTAL